MNVFKNVTFEGEDVFKAFSLISYVLFFLFTHAWFYDRWPLSKVKQPWQGLALTAISVAGGVIAFAILGAKSWSWVYFIPMWLIPTALDYWPVHNRHPAIKGTFWTAFNLVGTWVTILVFNAAFVQDAGEFGIFKGTDTFRANDFGSIIFGGMIYMYTFEGWPFHKLRQPLKGVLLAGTTLVLGALVLPIIFGLSPDPAATIRWNIADGIIGGWVFAIWIWLCALQWAPAPWPSRAGGADTPAA